MFFILLKLFLTIIFYQIHINFQGREINVGEEGLTESSENPKKTVRVPKIRNFIRSFKEEHLWIPGDKSMLSSEIGSFR